MSNRILAAAVIAGAALALWLSSTAPAFAQQTNPPAAAPAVTEAPQLSDAAADVLKLTRAKLSEEVILAFIQNDARGYNLGASEIVFLQEQGVSAKALVTMLNKPEAAPAPQAAQPVSETAPGSPPYLASPAPAPTYYAFDGSWPYWYDNWPYWYDSWPYWYRWHYAYWYDPWPYYAWHWYPFYGCGYLWAYHHHHHHDGLRYRDGYRPPGVNRPPTPGLGGRPARGPATVTRAAASTTTVGGVRPTERPGLISGQAVDRTASRRPTGTEANSAVTTRSTRSAGPTTTWSANTVTRPSVNRMQAAGSSRNEVSRTMPGAPRASISRNELAIPSTRPSGSGPTATFSRPSIQPSRPMTAPGAGYSRGSAGSSLGSRSYGSTPSMSRPSPSPSIGSSGVFSGRGSSPAMSSSSASRGSPFSGSRSGSGRR